MASVVSFTKTTAAILYFYVSRIQGIYIYLSYPARTPYDRIHPFQVVVCGPC